MATVGSSRFADIMNENLDGINHSYLSLNIFNVTVVHSKLLLYIKFWFSLMKCHLCVKLNCEKYRISCVLFMPRYMAVGL